MDEPSGEMGPGPFSDERGGLHGSEHALGWVIIAAIVVVPALTMAPSARAAERYLARHGSAG